MGVSEILIQIDREIAQLKQARALLSASAGNAAGSGQAKRKKRKLTPEGRKRIAEAVKRRWARQKAGNSK